MNRKLFWPVLIIGLAMIALPFVIGLPSKASHGQTMIDQFRPIMQPATVTKTVNYYHQTFVPLRSVAVGGAPAAAEVPQMMSGLAKGLHMTPAQLERYLAGPG
jgi:hypothetical protein